MNFRRVISFALLLVLVFNVHINESVSCLDDQGNPVEWWYVKFYYFHVISLVIDYFLSFGDMGDIYSVNVSVNLCFLDDMWLSVF